MTDYTELVKALRLIARQQDCNECEAGRWYNEFHCCLFTDAADAIEALQAELDKYHELCDVGEIPEVLEILMTV
jgi:hypothetical protein